jgi:hypothetical protein
MKRHSKNDYSVFAEGPSVKVFSRRLQFSSVQDFSNLEKHLRTEKPDWIITSSNWASNIEKKVWKMAEDLNLHTILYVDGIGDFRNTFTWQDENAQKQTIFPDEVWVTSSYALQNMIRLQMPAEKIRQIENFYLLDIRDRVVEIEKSLPEHSENRLLYVCENISAYETQHDLTDKRSRGYDEIEALEYFFESIGQHKFGEDPLIRVRPHPSESFEKYSGVLERYKEWKPEFSVTGSLLEADLAWSEKVVGCESTALLVALTCGKDVFACIPPKARTGCRFPHPEIIRI